jgi:hypothetical protein
MDTILLRDGTEFPVEGVDEEFGWPIIEFNGHGLFAVNPVIIQEGWSCDA